MLNNAGSGTEYYAVAAPAVFRSSCLIQSASGHCSRSGGRIYLRRIHKSIGPQGCRTNGTRKDFLAKRHFTAVPILFISFARPPSPYCAHYVYIHTYLTLYRLYVNYRYYEITQQWNIFTQIGAVRSFDWIFIVGAPVWRWLGEYVTLDRTFYSLLLEQEAAAASQLLAWFATYGIPRGGLYGKYNYNMH